MTYHTTMTGSLDTPHGELSDVSCDVSITAGKVRIERATLGTMPLDRANLLRIVSLHDLALAEARLAADWPDEQERRDRAADAFMRQAWMDDSAYAHAAE